MAAIERRQQAGFGAFVVALGAADLLRTGREPANRRAFPVGWCATLCIPWQDSSRPGFFRPEPKNVVCLRDSEPSIPGVFFFWFIRFQWPTFTLFRRYLNSAGTGAGQSHFLYVQSEKHPGERIADFGEAAERCVTPPLGWAMPSSSKALC